LPYYKKDPAQNLTLHPTMSNVTVSKIEALPVLVPFKITPTTASGALNDAALVLINVETSAGIIGHAYLFAFSKAMLKPLVSTIASVSAIVIGDPLAPLSLESKLNKALRLIDTPGLIGLALSGLDMAFWDAHSKLLGQSLARTLGSDVTSVPAYNSCGLWIQDVSTVADEAEMLLSTHDFSAVKLRLGRADPKQDLLAVQAVKDRIGTSNYLMADFNQSQTVNSAIQRALSLDDEGLYWIEEPVRHADYHGTARVRQAINTPIQTGENLDSNFALKSALDAQAADYYMPDAQRIGGVSGWLRAAAQCHAEGIQMSSHLFPEISVHLLAATPTRHWLEYVDWANPILENPLVVKKGHAQVPERPGSGISWDSKAVQHYLIN